MAKELPKTAKAVVIGGGIIGCSTAYHLGKLGWTDTVLLERKKLTSGTTFHAAGLVGQLRTSANITQLLGNSVDLYKKLEAETGLGTGWKMNGGLRLACNEERWTEVKRQATTAQSFGLDMRLLTPQEAFELWPLMTIDDLVGAAYLPTDGQANPSDITQALAKGARMSGVRSSRIRKFSTWKSTKERSAPSSPKKAASNANASSSAPVSGPGLSLLVSASTCRSSPSSISTSSPNPSACLPICRRCAIGSPHLLQGRSWRARHGRL
ncbi:hypothetical protein AJ87_01650 [Rhizobium yanglingense]|nr:hypothetical protein AJ87_01650 [Rhizobium yanglingense]